MARRCNWQLASVMREELAKREGRRGAFTATFQRKGHRTNRWGTLLTALLLDIRDEAGVLVADHAWFIWGQQMQSLQLKPGDRIRFVATVAPYFKRSHDFDWVEED